MSILISTNLIAQDEIRQVSIQYYNQTLEGEIGIWHKTHTGNSNKLTKPYIVVEGYDINGKLDLPYLYSFYPTFFANLRADGWDIIILNLKHHNLAIEKNAALFEKVLKDINVEVENNSITLNIPYFRPSVMGMSMGGLIIRYALAHMETKGEDHRVENMVCYDSPHKGANVPLGLQHLLTPTLLPLANLFNASVPSYIQTVGVPNMLNQMFINATGYSFLQEAVVQMSLNYTLPNTARTLFLADLASKGNYPSKCRRIAIANGSNGKAQYSNYDVDRNLFYWHGGLCLIDWKAGGFNIRYCPAGFGLDIYSMPGAFVPTTAVTYAGVGKDFGLLGGSVWIGPQYIMSSLISDYLALFRNNGNNNVDNVPGSNLFSFTDAFASIKQYVDNFPQINENFHWAPTARICLPKWYGWFKFRWDCRQRTLFTLDIPFKFNPAGRVEYKPNFAFVPTTSALDIETNSYDLWNINYDNYGKYPKSDYNIAFDALYPKKNGTPFDAMIYNPTNNSQHIDYYRESSLFLNDEISPINYYIQDRLFEGNYKNSFQARGDIALGNDVDPRTGRCNNNGVMLSDNANVTLVVSPDKFVYFDDGFETANDFTGVLEVQNYLGKYENLLQYSNTTSVAGKEKDSWKFLRKAEPNANPQFGEEIISVNKTSFNEQEVDAKHKVLYEKAVSAKSNAHASILPNPVNAKFQLTFTLKEDSKVNVSLIDINGREVKQFVDDTYFGAGVNIQNFDISELPNGYYLCLIQTAEYTDYQKLTIVH